MFIYDRHLLPFMLLHTTNKTHYIVTLHSWTFYENNAHFSFKVVALFLELNDFLLIHVTNTYQSTYIVSIVSCNIAEDFMIMWHKLVSNTHK